MKTVRITYDPLLAPLSEPSLLIVCSTTNLNLCAVNIKMKIAPYLKPNIYIIATLYDVHIGSYMDFSFHVMV